MSDFDFDEIDKAVNGAIEGDAPVQPRGSLDSSRETATPQPSPTMPAARRASSGRFMDMVHPSSVMRGRSASSTPSPLRTHTAAPISRIPEPPVLQGDTHEDRFISQDTAAYEEPAPKVQPVVQPEVQKNLDTRLGDDETADDWSTPLESPFLPGAKVEKRPLGGAAAAAEPLPFSLEDTLFADPKDELLEAPEEELKLEAPDDPRLEATALPDPIDFSQSFETPAVDETTLFTPEAPTSSTEAPAPIVEEPTASAELIFDEPIKPMRHFEEQPVGPTSITQQYKEQATPVQESGAMYDTESYHQPLAHPPKKRSGAWVILWIFLLVLLGAGVGAGFYFYVLPMI